MLGNHNNMITEERVCRRGFIKSNGIWFDSNFRKESVNVFFIQVILITLLAPLFHSVLRFLNQQKFVSHALAGVCIGYGLGQLRREWGFFPEEEIIVIRVVGSMGILYWVFLIGVKMDVTVLPKMATRASVIGITSFVAPCLTIFLLMHRREFAIAGSETNLSSYIFAAAFSATRFPNIALAFQELDLLTSDLAQLVMSSTMVTEIFTWITVALKVQLISRFVRPWPFLSILGMVVFTFIVIRPVMVRIVRTTPVGQPVRSSCIVGVLVGVMAMAYIGDILGSSHIGVFAMGIVVPSGPPLASELVMRTEVVVRDLLMPLFYLSMGYNVGLSHVFGDLGPLAEEDRLDLIRAVMLVVIGCFVKFVVVSAASLFCKLGTRHSLLVGLMMNIKGPFDMWIATQWVNAAHLKKPTYATLMLLQIAVNAAVTPIIVKLYNIYLRIHQPGAKIRCIQENPSSVELRILFCVHEEENVPGLITLLQASHNSAAKLRPYLAHLNELVGRAVPLISPTRKKLEVVLSKKIGHIERAFANHIKETNDLVMMGIFTVIAPYRTMHENICKIALDESIPLIIVPFHKHHDDEVEACAIRHLNSNVQDNAPCTIGILMDNGLGQCLTRNHSFSCTVAVIFIGGADDREALAFGVRMAAHEQVKLTVLRLIVQIRRRSSVEDGSTEKLLDNDFMEAFISNNSQNSNIQYCEAVAGNTRQALDRIRALGSGYDLVIVGRERKASECIFDELMVEWSEYPELGMIGDFVSSYDFNGGNTSALVIQRSKETDDAAVIRQVGSSSEYLSVDDQSASSSVSEKL